MPFRSEQVQNALTRRTGLASISSASGRFARGSSRRGCVSNWYRSARPCDLCGDECGRATMGGGGAPRSSGRRDRAAASCLITSEGLEPKDRSSAEGGGFSRRAVVQRTIS